MKLLATVAAVGTIAAAGTGVVGGDRPPASPGCEATPCAVAPEPDLSQRLREWGSKPSTWLAQAERELVRQMSEQPGFPQFY